MRHLLLLVSLTVACLVWACARSEGREPSVNPTYDRYGAIIRLPDAEASSKPVYFIFTADSMFEGGEYAMQVLKEAGLKASFFFTGNFLRDKARNANIINRAVAEGHYVGPHSDRHILLADWDAGRTTLADPDSAVTDMMDNLVELAEYGIDTSSVKYIVPPYEWYNREHIDAYKGAGLIPVSPFPGLLTYRDYTVPGMDDYYDSVTLWDDFLDNVRTKDLDGCFIILHLGTQDARTDKFYRYLPQMIDTLKAHGYEPKRL